MSKKMTKKIKTKKNRGFTLVEIIAVIILIAIIGGAAIVSMTGLLRSQKDAEVVDMETTILSAADAYVTTNPEVVESLYNGFGYVDITVGELRYDGLVSENLEDPETNEKVPDERIVRIQFSGGNLLSYDLLTQEEYETSKLTRWSLVAEDLNVEYDSKYTGDWCSKEQNTLSGLYYTNIKEYEKITSKLYFVGNNGEFYKGDDYKNDNLKLSVKYCNVDPTVTGNYRIEYDYSYEDEGVEISAYATRDVVVSPGLNDVTEFKVTINKIPYRTGLATILKSYVTIKETHRDGKTYSGNVNNYTFTNLTADTTTYVSGVDNPRTATISYNLTNSDGSRPKTQKADYTVDRNPCDVVSFKVTINDGNPVKLNSTINTMNIKIDETLQDKNQCGSKAASLNDYAFSNIVTNTTTLLNGAYNPRTATISYNLTNSDGSKPANATAQYNVASNQISDVIPTTNTCEKDSSGGCYVTGVTEGNYVLYNNRLFRAYYVRGNVVKLIYATSYANDAYGRIGGCVSTGCCNNGRYAYIAIGDGTTGISGTVMDTYLNNFASFMGGLSSSKVQYQQVTSYTNSTVYQLRSNTSYSACTSWHSSGYCNSVYKGTVPNGLITQKNLSKKVSLLSYAEYKKIAKCSGTSCSRTYLTGTSFWLVDFYSAQFGVGAYNRGSSAASIKDYVVLANGNVDYQGQVKDSTPYTAAIRPTIQLAGGIIKSGEGTASSPYVVE